MMYSRTGHRWQYNTAHALCMIDNWGYRHSLRIWNTYCFSTAKVVMRTRPHVSTSHVLLPYSVNRLICQLPETQWLLCEVWYRFLSISSGDYFIRKVKNTDELNPLTLNDHYSGRTAPLTSKRCILYIY